MITAVKKVDGNYLLRDSQIRWMRILSEEEMEKVMKYVEERRESMNPFITYESIDWKSFDKFSVEITRQEIEDVI